MRRAARIDENQPGIVDDLRKMGCTVQPLHLVGGGVPDLLVGAGGINYLFEVKNPNKPKSDQKLTPDQVEWHGAWRGQKEVIRTAQDAMDFIARCK